MACPRCGDAETPGPGQWCKPCELAYDAWSRRYASDVVWEALSGTTIVVLAGMLLPLLGLPWLVSVTGVFAGFGAFLGLHRLNGRRHRREYLEAGEVPRAYLPGKT